MLKSAELHYRMQQRYAAVGLAAARRAWRLGSPSVAAPALLGLHEFAARDGEASVGAMLAEQGITARPEAIVNTAAIAVDTLPPLGSAKTLQQLERMVLSQLADAARSSAGVAIAARRRIGWTRMVNPPCCARCAVLAGKVFRWNQGFQRHPLCDCRHIATAEDRDDDVRTDPASLFAQGQVSGVTRAETQAINAGADIGRVVNARRSLHMTLSGSARLRDIYRQAGDDQAKALGLLQRFGYLF